MPNGEIPTTSPSQGVPQYEFLEEFRKRNSLISAIEFALSGQCSCQACQNLKLFAEVLEEDRKKGKVPSITP